MLGGNRVHKGLKKLIRIRNAFGGGDFGHLWYPANVESNHHPSELEKSQRVR